MNFDLARMRRVMERLGNPHDRFPSVHVAGTNGKGSVTAMVADVLKRAGLRVGMTTSPHLEKVNERFQVNGGMISAGELNRLSRRIYRLFPHLTEFERLTALAFQWFAEKQVDVAVVETGLGGRLDATNVLSNVLVSVITTIDFDHMDWLGNTLEKIAAEKAGIIKPGVPVVAGASGAALRVIESAAKRSGSAMTRANVGAAVPDTALEGRHQRRNAAVALAAINALNRSFFRITPAEIKAGFKGVRWPGRFERIMIGSGPRRKHVILDGAHNPGGCRALAAALKEKRLAPVDLLFGALRDKDAASMAEALSPIVRRCVTVPVASDRSSDPRALAGLAAWKGKADPAVSAAAGWKTITAERGGLPVLVAGSLYLVGDIRRRIR